jgi:hypothetical protein
MEHNEVYLEQGGLWLGYGGFLHGN